MITRMSEPVPIIGGTGALGYGLAARWAREGIEVDAVSAVLWTISDGKGLKLYQSRAEAPRSRRAAQ